MGFLTLTVAIAGLSITVSLFAIGNRLGAIADAIREAGRR
jgi:hypothetical protein